MQWAAGDWLYVLGANRLPPDGSEFVTRVYRLNPRTGERSLWKSIPPVTPSSGGVVSTILFSADGMTCVYTHQRFSAELYAAQGWR